MKFSVEHLEFLLLVLARISGFVFTAPFFGVPYIPRNLKIGFCIFITILMSYVLPYNSIEYVGVIGFASLIIKEIIVGILIGYMANICTYILNFSGQLMDMEIGFSMVNEMNPVANIQSTITANLYTYLVMLMLIVTNMHHQILKAFIYAFEIIPIGKVKFKGNIYFIMLKFISEYFIIGFRIILPIFASMLVINVVLGILAKVAPQMNMFVIGMQLKVFVGLFILTIAIRSLPQVSQFIFGEMRTMKELIIKSMAP